MSGSSGRAGVPEELIERFRRKLLEWYGEHGEHSLPWRKTRDPWAVLLAALLLRKTTVQQVLRLYDEILKRYPEPGALAEADTAELERILRPLGMERVRARLLKRLAQEIVRRWGGRVPCSREELLKLPGVGPYAAAEVLTVACGMPEPMLDRNMIRVISRALGIASARKRPHTDPELWELARRLMPEDPEEAEAFNFAVLDFARKVCRARRPLCGHCVLKDICRAGAGERQPNPRSSS
ncbi:MAG: A/G-specific adenine glycosylase [Crenarchaeota archaeon]|nr:A/G-specific adenine glycosylase [Thermoproteota archaeon]